MKQRVIVLGAGLAGLSTSLHLGDSWDVEVYEREGEVGGVARSRRVEGFTFDYTGHLLHLRDDHVRALVDRLLPGAFGRCERRAFVYSHGTYVPFPFQANLHGLPPEVVRECVVGFVEALLAPERPEDAGTFREWAERCFGRGIARHFMLPYNAKLYARDLDRVTADWVSWSVPRPSLEQVVGGALGLANEGMGYNPTFLYPKDGGIDCLARALATEARGVRLGAEVTAVDVARRTIRLQDGTERPWDRLVTTLPLKRFAALCSGLPDWVREAAGGLTSTKVVGLNYGIRRDGVSDRSWVYVPEPAFPFYRIGFPATFSPAAAPAGCSSIYVEIALPEESRANIDELDEGALDALGVMGVLRADDEIVVREHLVIDPAYVIFDGHRQGVRDRLLDELLSHDVQSVGRYGAWTYSSMEDAILAGKRAADVIMGNADPREHRAGDR